MTPKELEVLQKKAAKWDALTEAVDGQYMNPDTGENWSNKECEEKGFDLCSIGEIAASHLGWLQ